MDFSTYLDEQRKLGKTADEAFRSYATLNTATQPTAVQPTQPVANPLVASQPTQPTQITHIVKAGETLSGIGQQYGTPFQTIYAQNKNVIGSNLNLIKPGQVLSWNKQPAFSVNVPATSDMRDVSDAFQAPAASPEIQSLLEGLYSPTTTEEIFKLEQGKLRYVPNMETFNQMYGSESASMVSEVAPSILAQYQQGEPIQSIISNFPLGNVELTNSAADWLNTKKQLQDATGLTDIFKQISEKQTALNQEISNLPATMAASKKTAMEEAGLTKAETELGSIEQEILDFDKTVEMAKQEVEGDPQKRITYAARLNNINAKSAIQEKYLYAKLSAKQGSYDRAYKLANEAYDDAKIIELTKIEGLQTILNQMAGTADAQQKDNLSALNYALEQQKDRLDAEDKMNAKKIDTMLKNPEAGISLDDSFEVIQQKIAPYQEPNLIAGGGGSKYVWDAATGRYKQVIAPSYAPTAPKEVKITDEMRTGTINDFFNSRRGGDQKISAESYTEAAQKWISMGGTSADFKTAFPADNPALMRADEIKRLPKNLQPKVEQTITLGGSGWDLTDD